MRRLIASVVLTATVSTAFPEKVDAQRPECRVLCRVTSEQVTEFGDTDEGVLSWNQILAASEDEYFVSHMSSPSQVQVFGHRDGYRGVIGREGLGPSELRGITNIEWGPDGNLWIQDGGNRALKIFSPGGEFVGGYPMRFSVSRGGMLVLPDSSLILNALVPTSDLVGLWTHRWHPEHGFMWSVDDGDPTARGFVEQRVYAVGGGFLWVARRWKDYRIEKRSLETGELLDAFELEPSWFADFQEEVGVNGAPADYGLMRPRATISDLQFEDGRLWVLGYTPGKDWRKAEDAGFRNLGVLLDNVVDVLSPDGRLLVSSRIRVDDGVASSFIGPGVLAAHRTGEFFDKSAVYRLRLRGPVPK